MLSICHFFFQTMENKPEYAPTLKISEGFIRGTTQLVDEHKLHLYQGIKYGRRVQSN